MAKEMNRVAFNSKEKWLVFIFATVTALIIFHISYGIASLQPSNISWLMTVRHDWGTHYLGWAFYKNEPWHFPIGKITGYNYPVGTNVGFTDSIPLLAIFFKLFAPLLSDNFQYFGLWLFLCHLLTAYFTVLLLRLFKVYTFLTLVAVVFITANPVLLYRGMHPALCAQWLLIASIYVYFLNPRQVKTSRLLFFQFVLLLLSASINPYLCWMELGFTLAIPLKLCFFDKVLEKKWFFGYLVISVFAVLLLWYIIGFVDFSKKEDLGVQGAYGLYAMNLNSFFNSGGYSPVIPQLKQVSLYQYEGFMYLGLGMMFLIAVLLIYGGYVLILRYVMGGKRTAGKTIWRNSYIPLLVLAFLYALFAITLIFTFNDKVLFTIPAPSLFIRLEEIFRASARFFWMPYYLIFFFTFIAFARSRIKPVIVSAVVLIGLAIQLYDLRILLSSRTMTYGSYTPPMDNKSWLQLMSYFDEIIFVPPFQSPQIRPMDYQDFSYLALKAGKPVNLAYVARADSHAMQLYSDSVTTMLSSGKLSAKALYITNGPNLLYFSLPLDLGKARLNMLDGCYFLFSSDIKNDSLYSLASRLNLLNRDKLDSTLRHVAKRNEFVATTLIPTSDKPAIRFNVEAKNMGEQFITMQGWAFVDSTQNNKGDSIFISLQSSDRSYLAPAKLVQRADITQSFSRTYLDDAGFNILAFTDSVQKGEYQVGIAIKNAKGKFSYRAAGFDMKIKAPEYATAEVIDHLPAAGKINYDVNVNESATQFSVAGWAAPDKQNADGCTIMLILKSPEKTYESATDLILRPDVTSYFKNKYRLDSSGYTVTLLKNTLEKGKYQIGLLIKDRKNNRESVIITPKEITIK